MIYIRICKLSCTIPMWNYWDETRLTLQTMCTTLNNCNRLRTWTETILSSPSLWLSEVVFVMKNLINVEIVSLRKKAFKITQSPIVVVSFQIKCIYYIWGVQFKCMVIPFLCWCGQLKINLSFFKDATTIADPALIISLYEPARFVCFWRQKMASIECVNHVTWSKSVLDNLR